ncbi:M14 family zinc carboxypeptidase [Reichenbachiella sp. MALMAid0571]|uniref:M14 family zinc carboxypeptidase n=1 Tax=Reichenbachiella sp. MALMAid0571 TaxID=3143939 RepID=UPI0032DED443
MKKVFLVLSLIGNFAFGQEIKIESDFPGGNIIISKITQDTAYIKPDLSLNEREWFHWYFKTLNISGKRVTFKFEQNNVFTKYGPAYSINNDRTWKWYGESRITNNSFTYSFNEEDTIAYFSVSIPYTEKNFNEFLSNVKNPDLIEKSTLCLTDEGRKVEKILISPSGDEPKQRVVITARHHACESSASFVLEGIIESVLNEKNLEYLRENVEFLILPFMDKDGVENGEQGKYRAPRDHNRDYDSVSLYQTTATIRNQIPEWGDGKIVMTLDIHSPWVLGGDNETIYMVGVEYSQFEKEQMKFSHLLEKNAWEDLKYYHKNFMPFGVSWNTNKNYSQGLSFMEWGLTLNGVLMSTTLEIPFANVSGATFSADGGRGFGKTVAYSIKEYLQSISAKNEFD